MHWIYGHIHSDSYKQSVEGSALSHKLEENRELKQNLEAKT